MEKKEVEHEETLATMQGRLNGELQHLTEQLHDLEAAHAALEGELAGRVEVAHHQGALEKEREMDEVRRHLEAERGTLEEDYAKTLRQLTLVSNLIASLEL